MRRWSISTVPRIAGLFAEDFDQRPEPPPVEPFVADDLVMPETGPSEDVAVARALGWADGHAAGLAEAAGAVEEKTTLLLAHIAAQLDDMQAAHMAAAEDCANAVAQLLCAALGTVMPALWAQHGAAEIGAVAAEIMPSLVDERVVRVQVAPENVMVIDQIISDLDLGSDVEVRVSALGSLGPSDIRMRWQHGEARREAGDLWRRVAAILTRDGFLPTDNTASLKAIAHVE